ncbi:nucleolar RNA helicase 2-like [Acanthaster planci]|uniref:Nucleolar RNA helicase 2-like n=1 Tax=Acanthaster planci TaxID=133434 RepID=A0A8B7ZKI1_ACAPL|nr:nucleolar RNA helicase 2-like [Acanthaster planci]
MPCAAPRMDNLIVQAVGSDAEKKKTKTKRKKHKEEKPTPEKTTVAVVNGHASPIQEKVKEEKKKKKTTCKKRKLDAGSDEGGNSSVTLKKSKDDHSEEDDTSITVQNAPELSPEEKEGAFENFRISPKTVQLLRGNNGQEERQFDAEMEVRCIRENMQDALKVPRQNEAFDVRTLNKHSPKEMVDGGIIRNR